MHRSQPENALASSSPSPRATMSALAELERELAVLDAAWLASVDAAVGPGGIPAETEVQVRQDFLDELDALTMLSAPPTERYASLQLPGVRG